MLMVETIFSNTAVTMSMTGAVESLILKPAECLMII